MSNYCTLKEAWGSPPSTMDWNEIRPKRKKKSSSRSRKKQVEDEEVAAAEPISDPSQRSLLPYDETDVNGAPYQQQNYAPKFVSKYSENPPQHVMQIQSNNEDEAEYVEDEEDRPQYNRESTTSNTQSNVEKDEHQTILRTQPSELEWLKNQVSYLLTKMDQLSTQLEQQQKTYTNVKSSSSASDILLFVVIGLFGILILDLFFRWGSGSTIR